MILLLITLFQSPPAPAVAQDTDLFQSEPVVAQDTILFQSQPVLAPAPALPVARPWEMKYADVYRKVEQGREFKIVAGEDLPGTTRVDDLPGMGKKLTHTDGRTFTVKPKVVYKCYLNDGQPWLIPADDAEFDKVQPVRDAAKKVLRGAVELVTPPYPVLQPFVQPALQPNCVGPS